MAESTRTSFGETGGITHVARLLQIADRDTFKIQALRVLGNACIDYGKSREWIKCCMDLADLSLMA